MKCYQGWKQEYCKAHKLLAVANVHSHVMQP